MSSGEVMLTGGVMSRGAVIRNGVVLYCRCVSPVERTANDQLFLPERPRTAGMIFTYSQTEKSAVKASLENAVSAADHCDDKQNRLIIVPELRSSMIGIPSRPGDRVLKQFRARGLL